MEQVLIGDLTPVTVPSGDYALPVVKNDQPFQMTVDQILGLVNFVQGITSAASSDNTFDDADLLLYLTGSAVKKGTVSGHLANIFKTARKIDNAQFNAATFKLFNAAGTPRALSFINTALTADRTVTFPDANLDFVSLFANVANSGKFALLQDQKASGTNGGGTTGNSWNSRALNTEVTDPFNIVTLSGGTFVTTIDCIARITTPIYATGAGMIRAYNVTDGVELFRGSIASTSAAVTGSAGTLYAEGKIPGGKTVRIDTFVTATQATNGFGAATTNGGVEVYTSCFLQGLAA